MTSREDCAPRGRSAALQRTLTRTELLDATHTACPKLSRAEARELMESVLDEMSSTLARGESVSLRSFGAFVVKFKHPRVGRNPKTGKAAPITARRVMTFKPSPVLAARVNGQASQD